MIIIRSRLPPGPFNKLRLWMPTGEWNELRLWFERLLAELHFQLWIGDAAEIRTSRDNRRADDCEPHVCLHEARRPSRYRCVN
jgi:hypothetical protein